jgi:hypothetical protein
MKKLLTIAALTASTFTAQADIRINGFANFTAGKTSSGDTQAGYDDTVDFSNGSLFGMQFSSDVNQKMTATAQIIARGENDYKAEFEWAYITYQASDNLSVTAGLFRLPLFNYSASKDIGYSYHWVSAPSTVYDVPFNNMSGVMFDYETMLGDWDTIATLALGEYKGEFSGADNVGENTVLLSYEASLDEWMLRAVTGRTSATIDLLQSTDASIVGIGQGIQAMNALGFNELVSNLSFDGDTGEFFGLSASYDNFDYFISAEATTTIVTNSFSNDTDAYYITAGARYGKWTPSITYERLKKSDEVKYQDQINAIGLSPLPAEVAAQFIGLATGLQLSELSDYNIVTLSTRYDYDTNIAIKAELSILNDDIDPSSDSNLFRVGLSYIF